MYVNYGGVLVFSWCRYFGHSIVGLYCMVLGGMVAIMCICMCDWEGILFMIDYNDGCGIAVFLGSHASPMGWMS